MSFNSRYATLHASSPRSSISGINRFVPKPGFSFMSATSGNETQTHSLFKAKSSGPQGFIRSNVFLNDQVFPLGEQISSRCLRRSKGNAYIQEDKLNVVYWIEGAILGMTQGLSGLLRNLKAMSDGAFQDQSIVDFIASIESMIATINQINASKNQSNDKSRGLGLISLNLTYPHGTDGKTFVVDGTYIPPSLTISSPYPEFSSSFSAFISSLDLYCDHAFGFWNQTYGKLFDSKTSVAPSMRDAWLLFCLPSLQRMLPHAIKAAEGFHLGPATMFNVNLDDKYHSLILREDEDKYFAQSGSYGVIFSSYNPGNVSPNDKWVTKTLITLPMLKYKIETADIVFSSPELVAFNGAQRLDSRPGSPSIEDVDEEM